MSFVMEQNQWYKDLKAPYSTIALNGFDTEHINHISFSNRWILISHFLVEDPVLILTKLNVWTQKNRMPRSNGFEID